ncbi:MAG: hypothetical protein JSS20_15465 [Proteobacteria bacterium]|nr:hypothetical protein [Pseudomonadota bacterium]
MLPPVAAAIEVLVLVVLPGLLDYAYPWFPNLNETQPHFFWLPVLLLTLQYGTPSGLLAAAAAIVLSNVLGWPEQEIGENHFAYLLRIWLQPMLWIGTAVVLGQLRLRQIEARDALSRDVATLSMQRHAIAEHARNLRARCDRLERAITTAASPRAVSILAALGEAASPDPHLAKTGFERALALAFGEASAAHYELASDGSLELVSRIPGSGETGAEKITGESELAYALIHEGRRLCAMLPGDEQALGGAAVAAVPVFDRDLRPRGALLLETASAGSIDAETAERLAAFAALLPASRAPMAMAPPAPANSATSNRARAGTSWRRLRATRNADAAARTSSTTSGRS